MSITDFFTAMKKTNLGMVQTIALFEIIDTALQTILCIKGKYLTELGRI